MYQYRLCTSKFMLSQLNKLPNSLRLCHAQQQQQQKARVILFGSEAYVYRKFIQLNEWYTRVIGLDEVKKHQDRVIELQEKLMKAQDIRRQVAFELTDVRLKSNELQDRINKTRRSDDLQGYLDLMREETEVLRLEKLLTEKLNVSDREERDLLAAFTNAIRDSHEKQRAQIEYTKYFGIVLSIVGSLLAFLFARIRNYDIKRIISESIDRNLGHRDPADPKVASTKVYDAELYKNLVISVEKHLADYQKYLKEYQNSLSTNSDKQIGSLVSANKTFETKLNDLASNVDKFVNKLNSFETSFNKQQKIILSSNDEVKKALRRRQDGPPTFYDSLTDEQHIGKLVLGTLGIGILYVLFFRS